MTRRPGRLPSVRLLLGLAAATVGVLVADASCQVTDGVVVDKRESVERLIDPYWRPVREVVVHFTPDDDRALAIPWQPRRWRDGVTVPLPTSLDDYDQLRPGAQVRVRYFPPLPDAARFADQPLADVAFGPLWEGLRESGILLDVLLLAWVILATWRRWWPGFFTRDPRKLGLLLVHLLMLQLLPLSLLGTADLVPPPTDPVASAAATLQESQTIRSVGHTRYGGSTQTLTMDLPRPFVRVLLRFVPAGRDQPVVTVDDVTPESVAGLTDGDEVKIVYPTANPRLGRLELADRGHRRENRLYAHALVTLPFVGLLLVGQAATWLVWGLGRTSRRAGQPGGSPGP
ncbi:MAG: hypothetical protein IT305_21315 [Chloroflexi bacterium]|nr:hypothetical protein [Chloroflexota bacterium]